jgi:hypothetical protein
MIDFTDAPYRDGTRRVLENGVISSRELHLAIPANTSPVHMQQIMRSMQHGIDNRVKVVITRVK